MKNRLFIILLLLQVIGFSASAQVFDWIHVQPGQVLNQYDIATDRQGNSYVTGWFMTDVVLGQDTLRAGGRPTFYVAKYNAAGQPVWARQNRPLQTPSVPVTPFVLGYKVAADAAGNVIIGATFEGAVDFGTGVITGPANSRNLLILKYDQNGQLIWGRTAIGLGSSTLTGIGVDGTGNIYCTGNFRNTLTISDQPVPTTLPASFGMDSFIAKFNSAGTVLWTRIIHDIGLVAATQGIRDLAVDDAGNAYLTGGSPATSITFGSITITQPNSLSFDAVPFSAKYDAAGNALWASFNLTHYSASNYAVSADAAGNCYVAHTGPTNTFAYIDSLEIRGTITKYNSTGAPEYQVMVKVPYWSQNFALQDISTDSSGHTVVVGSFDSLIYCPPFRMLSRGDQDGFLLALDPQGLTKWIQTVSGSLYEYCNAVAVTADSWYVTGRSGPMTAFGNYLSSSSPFNSSFIAKGGFQSSMATGLAYIDHNANGLQDSTERGNFEGFVTAAPGNLVATPDADGSFRFYTGTGTYTFTIPNPPLYHTVSPGTHTSTFSSYGQKDTDNVFALRPIPNQQDVRITLTQVQPAVPGFACPYQLTYRNIGTVPVSGLVKLQYDAQLQFSSSSVPFSSHSNNLLSWAYTNLQPGEIRTVRVTLQLPASASVGGALVSTAMIDPLAGDLVPADNTSTADYSIVASFDPNDKLVSTETLTPAQVSNGEWLEYTIRFQNTGTYQATTVVLLDTLSPNLQLPMLEVVAASHPYQTRLLNDRLLQVTFANIQLPDSATDEPGSHGFFRYRIRPNGSLQPGEQITNTAHIYFDFNAPVATNTTVTTISQFLGAPTATGAALQLYPNPSTGLVQLRMKEHASGPAQVRVLNALGQTVLEQTLPEAGANGTWQLDLSQHPKGLYLVQLRQGSRSLTERLVLQR